MNRIEGPDRLWDRHEPYCDAVRRAAQEACRVIGFPGACTALLVGLRTDTLQSTEIRVGPADTPYIPDDFKDVPALLAETDDGDHFDHPPSRVTPVGNGRSRELLDERRGRLVAEVLTRHPASSRWTFFAGRSVRAEGFDTYVLLGLETEPLDRVPLLPWPQRDRGRVPSLVHALMEEVLDRSWAALRAPVPEDRIMPLRASTSEIVRCAAGRLVRGAQAGITGRHSMQQDTFLNALSTLPYEGRPGIGALVLATRDVDDVEVSLRLNTAIALRDKRMLRKLMETSGEDTALLLDDEGRVHGLGRVTRGHEGSALLVSFNGRGAWDLVHNGQRLLSVRDGEATLPSPPLDDRRLRDLIDRFFPNADTDLLVRLAHAAGRHRHGAMLVISDDAAAEAARLYPQAITVEPARLTEDLVTRLTAMDGALLVDPYGRCHALGVILDGLAAGLGDPGRGSRYNNPVRYLGSDTPKAIVLVYSSDGGVDILPALPPRVDEGVVAAAVHHYVQLAGRNPESGPDGSGRLWPVFDAWDHLVPLSFYLSSEQCREVNTATARLRSRCAEDAHRLLGIRDLQPDPCMDATYFKPGE
ncbi:hypothetical protein OHT77_15670 [Streptomyces sp. NBC_00252]|uniref:hypothetical protein n=1 Tax=Streptomyces sp. NBC_00252 TaxID=2975691 RepID=UPI002E2E162A|nr:hypothetical protein [Streptomyces sp. NBC_00252]